MVYDEIKAICPHSLQDIFLKSLTTFKIGGKAKYVCYPQSIEELKNLIQYCNQNKIQFYVIGAGSNILADDSGFNGVIICTKRLKQIENLGGGKVKAQAGVTLAELLQFTKNNGLSGLEWATSIPATVGGAVVMNAGAFGGQISDICESVTILMDNEIVVLQKSKLFFNYRHSVFTNCKICVIIDVLFSFNISNVEKVTFNIRENMLKRAKTQSVGFASAGSVFKKTDDLAPAFMIEQCGLKGLRVGDAMVSPIHSGYIVNVAKATSEQVLALIDKVKIAVKDKFNKDLQLEIILLKGE